MSRQDWHSDDFTMCFSAEAHDLLFEELIFWDYVPGLRERMIVSVGGHLSEYTLSDSLPDLQQDGDRILMERATQIVTDLELKMLELDATIIEGVVTASVAEEMYAHLAEVLRLYGQIDTWYTEGLYHSDGSLKSGREEVAQIIAKSKNKLRGGLIDKTFFPIK